MGEGPQLVSRRRSGEHLAHLPRFPSRRMPPCKSVGSSHGTALQAPVGISRLHFGMLLAYGLIDITLETRKILQIFFEAPREGVRAGILHVPIGKSDLRVGRSRLPIGKSDLLVGRSRLPIGKSDLPVGRRRLSIGRSAGAGGRLSDLRCLLEGVGELD